MKYNVLTQMSARSLGVGKHNDGRGLYLVKQRKEMGKWILRLSINGKRREMGLGPWPTISIADAREQAELFRKQCRGGVDPIEDRRKRTHIAVGKTLEEVIYGCFEARQAELKDNGKAGRWLSPLKVHIVPKIGKVPVEQLDQHQIKAVLEPIWHSKPEAAAKALSRIRLSMRHAIALGLDVDLQAADKAKALLGKQRHEVQHIPSMPYKDVPRFYRWLTQQKGTSALALRLLILTATRTSEVRLSTFDEFVDDVWYLSAKRTKTAREHRIPLSQEALKVVQSARDIVDNRYLFSSIYGKPMSDVAMSKFMRTNGFEARPHGFRSSFRVWAEETTDAEYAVKEACLGHAVDGAVVGAYQRSDRLIKRRSLLLLWSDYLTQ